MKRATVLLCVTVVLGGLLVGGCGGSGGGGPLNRGGNGALTIYDRLNADGSRGDLIGFTATRDGWIEVTMSQFGAYTVDPYIIVWEGSSPNPEVWEVIGTDDDSGPGVDAYIAFWATRGERFTAHFTTYGSGEELGTYRWRISEVAEALGARAHDEPSGKAAVPPGAKDCLTPSPH